MSAQPEPQPEAPPPRPPWPADNVEHWPIARLIPYARNARTHSDAQIAQIAASIREWGWTQPVLVDEPGTIIAGHGRVLAARILNLSEIPVVIARGWTEAQRQAYTLADNELALKAGWNLDMLRVEITELQRGGFDVGLAGFEAADLNALFVGGAANVSEAPPKVTLADRFMLAPFSVLNAREGWWQARKASWLALGLQSEIGRGKNLLDFSLAVNAMQEGNSPYLDKAAPYDINKPVPDEQAAAEIGFGRFDAPAGTSIFDPVLCEIAYRWFCPPGGLVLDPFAGGAVRGIVAGRLGRRYRGVDLSAEQIAANEAQRSILQKDEPQPEYTAGDAIELGKLCKGVKADFVFSCPPYANLERYSDDPRDLSTMAYPDFLAAYRAIISAACALLKPNRFACFVVGEVRDDKGAYRGLVPDTIRAFLDAGLVLYNEAILVTSVGSLAVRVAHQFEVARKLGKTHQNVLVFCKGDGRKATEAVGPCEFATAIEGEAPAELGGEVQ